jgi:hypothetical protein
MKYLRWIKSVFLWDGMLPFVISVSAEIIGALIRKPVWAETTAILAVVVGALILRIYFALKSGLIWSRFRWQQGLFALANIYLFVLDGLLIVLSIDPLAVRGDEWAAWYGLYAIYLAVMALAQFPFPRDKWRTTVPEYDDFWFNQQ